MAPIKNGELPSSMLAPVPWSRQHLVAKEYLGTVIALGEAFKKRFGYYPQVTDAYRTLARQRQLFKELGSPKAAWPGTSNHGWGLSIDWASGISVYGSVTWKWMNTEGRKLSWRPLEESNLKFEPWHWTPTVKMETDVANTEQEIMNAVAKTAQLSTSFRRAIAEAVWEGAPKVARGGTFTPLIQELADIKTYAINERSAAIARDAAIANLTTAVSRIQQGEIFDPEKLISGVNTAVQKAVSEKFNFDITITPKN